MTHEVTAVIRAVANEFGVSVPEIMSNERSERIAMPRMVAMWLMRKYLKMRLEHVGHIFHKDHGTVMHACKRIEQGPIMAQGIPLQTRADRVIAALGIGQDMKIWQQLRESAKAKLTEEEQKAVGL